ncbi:site-specific integrase [Paraburkholderia strydomiana]|uniref:site-specific integrase n=1 Tax=Paraburkholderia strydomiana TaxID=1245417 RepID=UPI0038B90DD1
MARLDFIFFEPTVPSLDEFNELVWTSDDQAIPRIPQIFWEDGNGWDEANLWALEKLAAGTVDMETVKRLMKHLLRYAQFLESKGYDWRHFPIRRDEQPLRKFRKHLIDERDDGSLAASTATSCMGAVIQFYRFVSLHNLVENQIPMWVDKRVVIPFFDSAGFQRTIVRTSSDLAIPNRRRVGNVLEDGLLPVRSEHMGELLTYSRQHETEELSKMLSVGFFTGARLGTIVTLTLTSLLTVRHDSRARGVYLLPAGPGTGISTKFSVNGDLMVPEALLVDLRAYASSTERLKREAKAKKPYKNVLFLNKNGRPYTVDSVGSLVREMRTRAVASGLNFMHQFKFHQSRATFGTWLMELLLELMKPAEAVRIVKEAMFHKREQTTFGYITFLKDTRAKTEAADAFNEAFTGYRNMNWDNKHE